jgi:hypothetical protein
MEMHIDINTLLYPVEVGNKYTITLASSLSLSAGVAERAYVSPAVTSFGFCDEAAPEVAKGR